MWDACFFFFFHVRLAKLELTQDNNLESQLYVAKLLQLQGNVKKATRMLKKTLKKSGVQNISRTKSVGCFFLSYIALMDVTMLHTIRLMPPRSFLACFEKH